MPDQPTWDETQPLPAASPAPSQAGGAPPTWDETVDPEEKYGSLGQQAIAGGEGFLKGATLGASTVGERLLGVPPEDIRGREEANPWTSGLSQLGGSAALLTATGGVAGPIEATALGSEAVQGGQAVAEMAMADGASASTAKLIGEKAAQQFAGPTRSLIARAVGFGTEGAAFGAGGALSDAALGDPKLNGERVVSDIGMGAAFGAGLGLLSKGIEVVLPKAAQKLQGALGDLQEAVFGTPESPSMATHLLSVPGSAASGLSRDEWTKGFMTMLNAPDREAAIRAFTTNLKELAESSKTTADDLSKDVLPSRTFKEVSPEEFLEARSGNERAQFLSPKTPEDLANHKLYVTPDGVGYALSPEGDLQNVFNNSGRKGAGRDAVIHAIGNGAKTLDAFDGFLPGYYNEFGFDFKNSMKWDNQYAPEGWDYAKHGTPDVVFMEYSKPLSRDADAVAKRVESAGAELSRGAPRPSGSENGDVLHPESRFIDWGKRGELDSGAPSSSAGATPLYSESVTALDRFNQAHQNFEQEFMSKGKLNPSKVSSFFKQFGAPGQENKMAALSDFLTESQSVSKASENYYGYKAGEESISKKIEQLAKQNQDLAEVARAMRNSRGSLGSFGGTTKEALGAVGAHALGVPSPIVGAAVAALEAYKGIRNPYEMGANLQNVFHKLQAIGNIADGSAQKMANLASSVMTSNAGRGALMATTMLPSERGYDKKVERIQELAQNPQMMMDHLAKHTEAMADAAPNVSQHVQSTILNGVQFLNSKIPRSPNQLPLSAPWEPSRSQKTEFNRYYQVVDDPMIALKQVKAGTLNSHTMEALSAVYPSLLQDMRRSVMENITPKRVKNMPYATKMGLSMLMGQPLDESLTHSSIAANQMAFAGSQSNAAPQPKGHKTTLGGLKEIDIAGRTAPGSRIDDRDKD